MDALTQARISPWLSRTSPDLKVHLFHFVRADVGVGHPGFSDLWKALRERLSARARMTLPGESPAGRAFRRLAGTPHEILDFERTALAVANQQRIEIRNDAQDLGAILTVWLSRPVWVLDAAYVEGPLELVPASESSGGAVALLDTRGKLADLVHGVIRAKARRGRQGLLVVLLDMDCGEPLDSAKVERQVRNWYESMTGAALASHRVSGGDPTS